MKDMNMTDGMDSGMSGEYLYWTLCRIMKIFDYGGVVVRFFHVNDKIEKGLWQKVLIT